MRTLLLASMLSASTSLAQPMPGRWGGYVSGWVAEAPRVTGHPPLLAGEALRPGLSSRGQPYLLLQLAAQQAFFAQQTYAELQQATLRQQELAARRLVQQRELAAQQERRAREQELASQEQLLVQQQQLAVQQQLLAAQQQRAAAEEVARMAEREAKLKAREAEQKLLLEREAARLALARAEADARPRERGPGIHRWVDEDGVVHYSTRPRR